MTKHQNNLLEHVQKRALRTIYGYEKNYEELLQESGLELLEERRKKNFAKFAEKTLKNPRYSQRWFPQRELVRVNRHTSPYLEEKANGNRLFCSPIFAMRRHLNGNRVVKEEDISGIFNEP